jgi:osmotically-inducible protein OsmY
LEDLRLQERVIDELTFDPSVDAAHIGVSVHDGVVTLSGHVASFIEKHAAERAARRVRGVRGLAQEIEVHLPADKKRADDEIASRAVKLLDWDAVIPHGAVEVKVEHGIVTLTGEVDWAYQRAEAEHDVRKLGGVTTVINDVRIRPRVESADVRAAIRGALERHAELEAKGVTVAVDDGVVVLGGAVDTLAARDQAESAAWSAPGVTLVENRIVVDRYVGMAHPR